MTVAVQGEYTAAAQMLGDARAYNIESLEARSILESVPTSLSQGGIRDEEV